MHVESVSYTIAKYLGLNTDLTKAISVAHDILSPLVLDILLFSFLLYHIFSLLAL